MSTEPITGTARDESEHRGGVIHGLGDLVHRAVATHGDNDIAAFIDRLLGENRRVAGTLGFGELGLDSFVTKELGREGSGLGVLGRATRLRVVNDAKSCPGRIDRGSHEWKRSYQYRLDGERRDWGKGFGENRGDQCWCSSE